LPKRSDDHHAFLYRDIDWKVMLQAELERERAGDANGETVTPSLNLRSHAHHLRGYLEDT
jgi:hypothetical protein